jgi:hypothetical protein
MEPSWTRTTWPTSGVYKRFETYANKGLPTMWHKSGAPTPRQEPDHLASMTIVFFFSCLESLISSLEARPSPSKLISVKALLPTAPVSRVLVLHRPDRCAVCTHHLIKITPVPFGYRPLSSSERGGELSNVQTLLVSCLNSRSRGSKTHGSVPEIDLHPARGPTFDCRPPVIK